MMKKYILITFLCFLGTLELCAQTVQGFTYDSFMRSTSYADRLIDRDTVLSFPTGDHNQYAKILMHYSMRCRDALVSTGAERNKGCGEWDYSCNTYVVDSTQMDSLPRTAPTHLISNFSETTYNYTTQPTHTYYQSTQQEVSYNSTNSESSYQTGMGNAEESLSFGDKNVSRSQLLYPATSLQESNISGIKIDLPQNSFYQGLRIKMKNSTLSDLSNGGFDDGNLTEVYFQNTTVTAGEQFLKFYQNFTWDGSSNLLIDISYANDAPISNSVDATSQGVVSGIHADGSNDHSIEINAVGEVEFSHPLPSISDQITLTAWTYGFSSLPVNTYLLEGADADGRRQINVHLPWENGQVYWDCGNSGSGSDRINKQANPADYKDQWNHWAFTKNTNTGEMNIYLNGVLWHAGSDKFNPIDIQKYTLGANVNLTAHYRGKIDEVSLWNKELNQAEIQELMYNQVQASHPQYASLVAYYNFNDDDTEVMDQSGNDNHGTVGGVVSYRPYTAKGLKHNITRSSVLPNLTLVNGDYDVSINEVTYLDSLVNAPNQVRYYSVQGTDLVETNTAYFYEAKDQNIFDESGTIVGTTPVTLEGTIEIGELDHYIKSPMRYELMSFVTPYGINLDFGQEGKTWTFDVTDYGPILKGDKKIIVNRGGQWQEEMDIKFEFIPGTPPRDIISTKQIYQVISANNASIRTDANYEPRRIPIPLGSDFTKVKAVITGHGQSGEFEPRNHHLNILGGGNDFSWFVDTECSDNPIFPQGGTWIYDRAGWCPGAASDVEEFDLTPYFMPGDTIDFDYTMDAAGGDSRYIVNIQMMNYGPPNYTNEIEIVDVAIPSTKAKHIRHNANCTAPKIVIKNNGSELLQSLDIEYFVNGAYKETYEWTGALALGEEREVTLPYMNSNAFILGGMNNFEVNISNPNGQQDENMDNNSYTSEFQSVDHLDKVVVIKIRTNSANFETRYSVLDIDGKLIHSSNGFSANTTYLDTLSDLHGCYRLAINDSGEDGIAWWANNDGNGYIEIASIGQTFKRLEPDFGSIFNYEFVADDVSSNQETLNAQDVYLHPNPTNGRFKLSIHNQAGNTSINIFNAMGQEVYQENIDIKTEKYDREMDLSRFDSGIYHVQISNQKGMLTKQIVKI